MSSAQALAEEWIDAFNGRNLTRLLELAAKDFELVTMHRGTLGKESLPGFMARQTYGVGLHRLLDIWFERGYEAVGGGRGEWRYVETGEPAESGQMAAAFLCRDAHVVRMTIHPDLVTALDRTRLGEWDELRR